MLNTQIPETILSHIDTLGALRHQQRNFSTESENGSCDFPRMYRNNVKVGVFAIFPAMSQYNILNGLDQWLNFAANPQNHIFHITKKGDFIYQKETPTVGAILHTEGSGGFDSEFILLRLAYRLGLRSLGITWANINQFGTGFLFQGDQKLDRGLTSEGRALVHEAQKLGITIDMSHLNDKSFWDVMEETEKPLLATHSNARAICPTGRNLSDAQIHAIHENHGVIGLNFGTAFLDPQQNRDRVDLGFDVVTQHLNHLISQSDINTVALGTDFDGTTLPNCLRSCDDLPQFYAYLLANGYSKQDLKKIGYENLYRVYQATWTE